LDRDRTGRLVLWACVAYVAVAQVAKPESAELVEQARPGRLFPIESSSSHWQPDETHSPDCSCAVGRTRGVPAGLVERLKLQFEQFQQLAEFEFQLQQFVEQPIQQLRVEQLRFILFFWAFVGILRLQLERLVIGKPLAVECAGQLDVLRACDQVGGGHLHGHQGGPEHR